MILDNKGRKYRRLSDHLNFYDTSNRLKNSVIKKILKLKLNIKCEIIKDNTNELDAFNLEVILIKKYGRRNIGTGILTNLTDGGEGGSGHTISDKGRQEISRKNKERIKLYGANFKGCRHSLESRVKMSFSQKERAKNYPNSMQGKKHTEETKKKISDKLKGKSTLPKEKWYKFSNPGKKNPQAKKYIFINPNGEKFLVIGEFKKFIKDHELAYDCCKNFRDKGKIPAPINPNHHMVTQERKNSTNWEIKSHV